MDTKNTKTAKHTPGPWGVEAFRSPLYPEKGETLIVTNGKHCIATPNHVHAAHVANARLIAAAPELLDIAQRWLEWSNGPVAPIAVRNQLDLGAIEKGVAS